MAFDFTPGETDNALYLSEVRGMDNDELVEAYRENMRSRGEGGDAHYNISMCLDIIINEACERHIPLPPVPEDNVIYGYIKQTDTPESSSIEGYGYDFYEHTIYIKYKNGKKVYAFYEVPEARFKQFQAASSMGKEVALLRKEYNNKQE